MNFAFIIYHPFFFVLHPSIHLSSIQLSSINPSCFIHPSIQLFLPPQYICLSSAQLLMCLFIHQYIDLPSIPQFTIQPFCHSPIHLFLQNMNQSFFYMWLLFHPSLHPIPSLHIYQLIPNDTCLMGQLSLAQLLEMHEAYEGHTSWIFAQRLESLTDSYLVSAKGPKAN